MRAKRRPEVPLEATLISGTFRKGLRRVTMMCVNLV